MTLHATTAGPTVSAAAVGPHPLATWLFARRSLTGLGVFRIALGAVLLIRWGPRWPHVGELYASDAFLVPWGYFARLGLPHFPYPIALVLYSVLMIAIVAFTIGWWTRAACAVSLVLLMYFVPASAVFCCAVDRLSILSLFFLCFGPAGATLSADRALAEWSRCRRSGEVEPRRGYQTDATGCIWTQRVIAVSFALLYVFAPMYKIGLDGWAYLNGKALGYSICRWQFATSASRFFARHAAIMVPMAVMGVFGEWFIAVGLFVRRLRPIAIVLGTVMHLLILFTVLIPPGLSLIMIASYALFVEPETWRRLLTRGRAVRAGGRHWLIYDGQCAFCRASVALLKILDSRDALEPVDLHAREPEIRSRVPGLTRESMLAAMQLVTPGGGVHAGYFAFRRAAWAMPALWTALPFLYLPGMGSIGPAVYGWVARHRYRIIRCTPDGACSLPQ